MLSKTHLLRIIFLPLFFFFSSCVKDVDMDQYQNFAISPTVTIDLVFFDLILEDFSTGSGSNFRAVDETRLEFLDDDYVQTSLLRADFNFRFANSFENAFDVFILFQSESNIVRHQIHVEIPAGTITAPAVVDLTEIINSSQIERIRNSIKVSFEVHMKGVPETPDGSLTLQSKGTYYFEFK